MARRKEDMTPEEHAAMKERMLELRQMAHKKIQERTAAKREAEDLVRKARQEREIHDAEKAKQVLAEIEAERAVAAAKATTKHSEATTAAEPSSPPPPPPPPKKARAKTLRPSDSSDDDASYKAFMKEKLKAKYKTKYQLKYAQQASQASPAPVAPPPPQLTNPVTETARDVLKSRVTDEVRKMAMASLLGGGW